MKIHQIELKIYLTIILTSFCLLSNASIHQSQSNPAYTVAGFVINDVDSFIPNATVTLTMNRTGESLSTITDTLGRYIFDLGMLNQGYEYDDFVFVLATRNSLSGFAIGTIIESKPSITINITIKDITVPKILFTPPLFLTTDENVVISATIEDDIEVQSSRIYYMFPGDSSFQNEYLALYSGNSANGIWLVTLSEPMLVGKFFCYITANDTAMNINTSEIFSIDVINGQISELELSVQTEVAAGDKIDILCIAVDKYGNNVKNYTGTITLTSTDSNPIAQASVYSHPYASTEEGTYTFTNITLCTSPIQTITAIDLINNIENNITIIVKPGTVKSIKIYPNIITLIAGTNGVFSARLVDEFSNVVSAESDILSELHTTSNSGIFSPSSYIVFSVGSSSVNFLYMDTNITGSPYTLSTSSVSLQTENASVYIVSSDVDRWMLKANSSFLVAGGNLSVNVSIIDRFNNSIALAENTTVNLYSSSTSGSFALNGQKVNSVIIAQGSSEIWVNYSDCFASHSPVFLSASNGSFIADGIILLDIIHSSPAYISLISPAVVIANEQFNITAKIYDKFGNIAKTFAGFVNLSIGGMEATETLNAIDEGTARFDSLSITKAGEYDLLVECSSTGTITNRNRLSVIPGEVGSLNLSAQEIVEAGNPFDIVVLAVDLWDNIVKNYTGTVIFSSSDDYPAMLPDSYAYLVEDEGMHLFSDFVLFKLPFQTINVTDVNDDDINGFIGFFIYDDTPPVISYNTETGVIVDGNGWIINANATDDIRIKKALLFYSFDNMTFIESEMSQLSGNVTTGNGEYSITVPLDDQSRIFFYFEVFDGQNWIFLKSEYGHAFSSVYETSLFDSIFFYLILVIIVVVILFLVLIILKRKNMKGKGVDPEKKY